ncbi:hypothetical protein ACFLQV_03545 [Calditrichota bacterium]
MNRLITLFYRVIFLFIVNFVIAGCEGKMGPPGISPPGVDTTTPTIKLIRPLMHSYLWDEVEIKVEAIDNVAVREVLITVDGSSFVGEDYLRFLEPPYEFDIDLIGFRKGWHYIAARAYDLEGNSAATPVVPVFFDFSSNLVNTTINFSFFNGKVEHSFTLPDSLEHEKFWTRFNLPTEGFLRSIRLQLSGEISDSSSVYYEIYKGSGIPTSKLYTEIIPDSLITVDNQTLTISLPEDSVSVNNDFFVVLGFSPGNETDTLRLAADDGLPAWGSSGTYSTTGWFSLSDVFGLENNLGIECEVHFEP